MHNLRQLSLSSAPEQLIEAIGGEPLAGSGFEQDDPEVAFAEADD
jgi:hypothetical protein